MPTKRNHRAIAALLHTAAALAITAAGFNPARATTPITILTTDATWKTTSTSPPAGWNADPSFNDASWIAAFHSGSDIWYGSISSASSPDEAWFRQTFNMTVPVTTATGSFSFDDDGENYLNGHLLINDTTSGPTSYSNIPIDPSWFVVGQNVFAIHGVNTGPSSNYVSAKINITAVPIVKQNNLDPLNQASSWVGGVPAATETVAVFNSIFANAAPLTLGADLKWGGIQLLNPGGAVAITGPNVLTLGAGGIDMSTATQNLNLTGGTVSISATSTFSVAKGRTLLFSEPLNVVSGRIAVTGEGNTTIAGGMQGASSIFEKQGLGTMTFSGPSSIVSGMTLSAGVVLLNFAGAGSPQNNLISGMNFMQLAGGTLQMTGANELANSETFTQTSFDVVGASTINVTSGVGGSIVLALGTVSRGAPGGIVIFNGPGSGSLTMTASLGITSAATNGLIMSNSSFGNAAAFAFWGLSDYAALNSGKIVAGSSVANFYTPSSTAIGTGARNVNLDIVSADPTNSTATGVNAVRFNNPSFTTLTLGNTFATGGVLVTPNVGASNVAIVGNKTLLAGFNGTSNEMTVVQNNTAGVFTIAANLGPRYATFAGAGTTFLTGDNTMGGATRLLGGFVVASSNNSFGTVTTAGPITLYGGTLVANPAGVTLALDNGGINARNISVQGVGSISPLGRGGLAALDGKTLLVSGIISGAGTLTIGAATLPGTGPGTANPTPLTGTGTVTLSGTATSFTGAITVAYGTLNVTGTLGTSAIAINPGAVAQLGPAGNLGTGAITVNGLLQLNRPDAFTLPNALTGTGTLLPTGGGTATLTGNLNINALQLDPQTTLALNSSSPAKVNSLTLSGSTDAWTSLLLLNNNGLILQSADATTKAAAFNTLANQLKSAYNNGIGGGWNGPGISSAAALADPTHYTVALADGLDLSTYLGQPIDPNALLVTPALIGDATLDGHVNSADLDVIAAHWHLTNATNWAQGDLNGDHIVDSLDVEFVVSHWDADAAFVPVANYAAGFTYTLIPVPEPATSSLLMLVSCWLFQKRRRNRCNALPAL